MMLIVVLLENERCSKSSALQIERRGIAEIFSCGKTLPLFIKLEKSIQISILISVQVRLMQKV